ncbi:MAG: hypothetical protein LC745_06270, partial [Planctomycetia bacterium]|nr:hypothetical protein [Planctomycetia bacterium]
MPPDAPGPEIAASTDPTPRRLTRALGVVALAALLVRGALLTRALIAGRLDDPDQYLPLARSLAGGHGFATGGRPTAYRPPLYPMALAPVVLALGGR